MFQFTAVESTRIRIKSFLYCLLFCSFSNFFLDFFSRKQEEERRSLQFSSHKKFMMENKKSQNKEKTKPTVIESMTVNEQINQLRCMFLLKS